MTIIQAANNGGERRDNDFYPTPKECVWALLPEIRHFPQQLWEPCCGDGGIARELETGGYSVVGTDLVDRGYGEGGVDFLATTSRRASGIVTNPPFGTLVSPFISHALELGVTHLAVLVNVNLWHAVGRTKLWEIRQPEIVYALCWRPDFTGAGRPYFNCVWTVWGPKSAATTRYERLAKPKMHPAMAELVG